MRGGRCAALCGAALVLGNPAALAERVSNIYVLHVDGRHFGYRGVYATFGPSDTAIFNAEIRRLDPIDACVADPRVLPVNPFIQDNRLDGVYETMDVGGRAREVQGPGLQWVALVLRGGNCTFLEKVQNVQRAGASAVIVGNSLPSEVVVMASDGPTAIPAVSVSGNVFGQLEALGARATLLPGPDFEEDLAQSLERLKVDFTVFLVAFCMATLTLSTVLMVRHRVLRLRAYHAEERRARKCRELARDALQHLPKRPWSGRVACKTSGQPASLTHIELCDVISEDANPEDCAICLDTFVDGDCHRELPFCSHGQNFHIQCIDPWLLDKQTCPMCKSNFMGAEDQEAAIDDMVPESARLLVTL